MGNTKQQVSLNMDELLIGNGWHEVEKEAGVYYRWMGKDNKASIHLNPARNQENRLNICIHAAASEEILQSLSIKADGIPLYIELSEERNPSFVTAVLPADHSKPDEEETVLTSEVSKTLPADKVVKNGDNKKLFGIALRSINIFPLGRALFVAQKYNNPYPFNGIQYLQDNPGVKDAVIQEVYGSAYEYYLKHDQPHHRHSPQMHEQFDECPGDIIDILRDESNKTCREVEEKQLTEIDLLRDIVQRQGDTLRAMQSNKT